MLPARLKAYNITIEIEEKESEKTEGTILSQSLPERKRVDLIKGSIKFVVAKKAEEIIETPITPDIPTSGTEEGNGNETGGTDDTDTPTEETPTTPNIPEEPPTEPEPTPENPTTETTE